MMSERDWHLIPKMCRDIILAVAEAREAQTARLATYDLTWEQVKAFSDADKAKLQTAWIKNGLTATDNQISN